MDYLVGDRLFDGDWTHPQTLTVTLILLMMAGKFVMDSIQTKVMELLVTDIGFRENRARTISSITTNRAEYPLRRDKFPNNLSHK